MPIAIKKSFNLIAKGFEYLENTPDKSKSISWAVFENGDKKVAVCNTHFWWMDGNQSESDKKILKPHIGEVAYWSKSQHDELRTKNAKQLSALMKQLSERFGCTVFAFGDMNTTISSDVFKIYSENNIKRLFDLACERDEVCSIHGNPKRGEDGKFHGEKTKDDYKCSIDHIVGLGDGFSVKEYRIVEAQDALDVTDHSPVYADIILK